MAVSAHVYVNFSLSLACDRYDTPPIRCSLGRRVRDWLHGAFRQAFKLKTADSRRVDSKKPEDRWRLMDNLLRSIPCRSFVAHVADMFASRILFYASRRSISEWSSDNKDIKDWSKSLAVATGKFHLAKASNNLWLLERKNFRFVVK